MHTLPDNKKERKAIILMFSSTHVLKTIGGQQKVVQWRLFCKSLQHYRMKIFAFKSVWNYLPDAFLKQGVLYFQHEILCQVCGIAVFCWKQAL